MSAIRRYTALAAEREDCIVLTIGEPDLPTPAAICEAAVRRAVGDKPIFILCDDVYRGLCTRPCPDPAALPGLRPAAVVVVATVRALKMHGGLDKSQLDAEDSHGARAGNTESPAPCPQYQKRVSSAVRRCARTACRTDTEAELKLVEEKCAQLDTSIVLSDVWAHGGEGGKELAEAVVRLCEEDNSGFGFCYEDELGIEDKISAVVRKIYGGRDAVLLPEAKAQAEHLTALGFGKLPVCIAKTQSSFSDDAKKLGAPEDFTVTVRQIKVSAGAGFTVALAGNIMTMPGLPQRTRRPRA